MRVLAWPATTDGANPYIDQLTAHLAQRGVRVEEFSARKALFGRFDVWHMHWPDGGALRRSWLRSLWSAPAVLLLMIAARLGGTALVWTAHNLEEHDRRHPALARWFWRGLTERLDGVIGLTESGLEQAVRKWPSLQNTAQFVIPHGHYRDVYGPVARNTGAEQAAVKGDGVVGAFVGRIKRYKNVEALVRAHHAVGGKNRLIVAGKPDEEVGADIREAAGASPRVELHLRFLAEAEMVGLVHAADVVILPYSTVLNSGSALMALSLDTPVVVPHVGAMPELQASVGKDWVMTYEGAFGPAVLESAYRWARRPRPSMCDLSAFDWPPIAAATAEVYAHIAKS